jgi:hypothetical protein
MKTSTIATTFRQVTVLTIGLTCTLLLLNSCDKSNYEYLDQPIDNYSATAMTVPQKTPMNFTLDVSNCFSGGTNVSVRIENPTAYSFRWEVDGSASGSAQSTTPCVCGETAKVTVTRISDGSIMSKSVKLPSCGEAKNKVALLKKSEHPVL